MSSTLFYVREKFQASFEVAVGDANHYAIQAAVGAQQLHPIFHEGHHDDWQAPRHQSHTEKKDLATLANI
jgi:hypothetical protein